jgi:hypothetical protein
VAVNFQAAVRARATGPRILDDQHGAPPPITPDPLPRRPGGARTAEKNRVQKLLEDAQIKLSVVASDIFGASSRDVMAALIAGRTVLVTAPTRMRQAATSTVARTRPKVTF